MELFATIVNIHQTVVSNNQKKGDAAAWKSRQIMVSKWKHKRDIPKLSTIHAGKVVEGSKEIGVSNASQSLTVCAGLQ